MRRLLFVAVLMALAMPAAAKDAPIPYEKPELIRDVLTKEYVEQNREYLEGIDSYFGNCTGWSPLHFSGEWSRYVTIVEYRDRTVHVIYSMAPPEFSDQTPPDSLRVAATALIYSVSPSDRGSCGDSNAVELLDKEATMDFQTTLRVSVWNDTNVTITQRLANASELPVASIRILELTDAGRYASYGLRFRPGERLPKLSTPYKRIAQKFRFKPALTWDLGFMPGIIAVSDGYVPPVPGFSFLRDGRGTAYNLTGLSLWLASSRDARFRFAKFGAGLGFGDRWDRDGTNLGQGPALTLQFAPVGIAFGQKERWSQEKAYTWLDRTRRRVYLDVGYNVHLYGSGGGIAHGPYVQTSICVLRCNP